MYKIMTGILGILKLLLLMDLIYMLKKRGGLKYTRSQVKTQWEYKIINFFVV